MRKLAFRYVSSFVACLTCASHSMAICNDDGGSLNTMTKLGGTAVATFDWKDGLINSIGDGKTVYTFVRDPSTGKIVGVRSETNELQLLNNTPVSEIAETNQTIKNGKGVTMNGVNGSCGGGGGPYNSDVMRIEITSEKAPSVPFWGDTISGQIYIPQMPVSIEPPSGTPAERLPQCTAQANNCLTAANDIASGVYGVCAAAAQEASQKRGRWWGGAIFGVVAAACIAGIEYARSEAKSQCYSNLAKCAAGG